MDTEFENNSGDRRREQYTGGRPRHEKSLSVCFLSSYNSR